MLERLVVRLIARPGPCKNGADQAGERTSNTTSGLDVFRRALRLAVDSHQPQAIDVDTHRQHVGGQYHVNRPDIALLPARHVFACRGIELGLEFDFQMVEVLRYIVSLRHPSLHSPRAL